MQMKRILSYIYFSLLFALGIACSGAGNNNMKLQEQILAVHDSIMPKMGEFVRDELKIGVLSTKMDSLKAHYPDLDTLKEKEALLSLQQKLKAVNESMTDWMHAFEPEQESKTAEETQKYLQDELQNIRKLRETFLQTEQESEKLLAKYK